jgi:hypothetical protein
MLELKYKKLNTIIVLLSIFYLLCFHCEASYGDNDVITYNDSVYTKNIKTVQLYKKGWELSFPVIDLNSDDKLELSFDELGDEQKNYSYSLLHCDADWGPSSVSESEFMEGFNTIPIYNYNYSFTTTYNYIHYSVDFPDENTRLLLSGNYIIKVFESSDPDSIIFTKRFYVTEQKVKLQATVRPAADYKIPEGGQEIEFKIQNGSFPVADPARQLTIFIIQNNDWHKNIKTSAPLFIKPGELDYSYAGKFVFGGGNEFRQFDIANLKYQTENVALIDFRKPYYHVILKEDKPLIYKPYFYHKDLNGKYYINKEGAEDKNVEADYAYVNFRLSVDEQYAGYQVYVFGGLTNWNINDDFEMTYNPVDKLYELETLLKQGTYNYSYALVNDDGTIDTSAFEGDHEETENEYRFFVYYTDLNGKYDRLICTTTFNSMLQEK